MQLGERPRLRRPLDWRSGSLKGEERERLNIVRPREPRVARTLFEARCDGSPLRVRLRSLAHSRLRTNEQWPLYTEPKNLFSLCRRRFRMWLHRMRDQTTLFEGTEPRRDGARVRWLIALFHYQGIFLVQRSGRSHLCLYRQLILLCAKIFLAGPTSAEVRESRNRKTFDEITHDEKSNKYYGM